MDIYICTDDVRVGRALALEAQAAGFSAAYGRDAADALLSVRDLDFTLPGGAPDGIAFSRDEERLRAAALFGSAAGNVVDVYACYLRKKLAAVIPGEVICARRGAGYALADGVTLDVL